MNQCYYILLALVAAMLSPLDLCAGLPGPPPSYIVPTRDGRHFLVMLSSVPVNEDGGNDCQLPNGQQARLREMFPCSGLYALGSDVPMWTVDWYGTKRLVRLSDDGRHMVRVNLYGGGHYGEKPSSYWAIKFYDAGQEIQSYNVNELVDHLSFMEYTSSGWHYQWFHDSAFRTDVDDNRYTIRTSCREIFTFDVTTGRIVSQYHGWRVIARTSLAILLSLIAIVGIVLFQYLRGTRPKVSEEAR